MTLPVADSLEERLRAALAPSLLLVREIGAGGMARVFLAREPALRRLVAVKVLSGELAHTEAGRARFEREAQAVAGLSHPNIVSVHAVGELSDGTPYFIMQYVEGRSMAERVEREGPLSVAEARRALGEVAAALAVAHKAGIIHRDIKPANILYEDATGRALVSDFGIAAVGRETPAVNTRLTATGAIVGTPAYMSPEQLLAEPVTEKTDIYSLGLLAHELLAGSAPFKGSSPHELIAAHLRDVPARLNVRRPDADPELDDVVARCLEKTAASRPTADEVARRLAPGAGALLEWPPPGLEHLHGRLRRVAGAFMLGGVSVGLSLFVLIAAGPSLSSVLFSVTSLLLLAAMAGGVIAIGVALTRAVRAGRAVAQAIRSGYAWMTVLETMADVRGDTGNLIAASREYAGLKPEQRDRLRRDRVRREMVLLAGGVAAIPVFVVVVVLGSAGLLPWWAATLVALVPLGALGASAVAAAREDRAFAPLRARRAAVSADEVARLAPPWYETFEAVRQGQRTGRGAASRADAGRWTALALAGALSVMILVTLPLSLVSSFGPTIWSTAVPKFANTQEKMIIANLVRRYDVPNDPRITPAAAGQAFYAMQAHSRRNAKPFVELPVRDSTPPPPWTDPIPAGVLASTRFSQNANIPSPLTIFAAYRKGFSAADLAFLERLATAPGWKHVDVLARARSMDYLGARYRLPFPDDASAYALPIPRFSIVKDFAYASASRAAWHLARGRRDSAEVALRSTVSLGLLLMDEGNTLIEQLIGAVVVGIGRQGLIDYYKTIGDPRGAAIQAQMDSVNAAIESRAGGSSADQRLFMNVDVRDAPAVRSAVLRVARDPKESRGLRIEMLYTLGAVPCTNLKELVFGPGADVRAAFDHARKTLGRFASDTALFDLMEQGSERVDIQMLGVPVTPADRFVTMIASAVGNRRLRGCLAITRMNAM